MNCTNISLYVYNTGISKSRSTTNALERWRQSYERFTACIYNLVSTNLVVTGVDQFNLLMLVC